MGRKYVGLDNTLESFEGTPLGSPLGSWFQSASCLHNENLFCVVSTGVQTVSAVRGMGRCFSWLVKKKPDGWIKPPGITILVPVQGLTLLALPPPNFRHYFILHQGSKSVQLIQSVL